MVNSTIKPHGNQTLRTSDILRTMIAIIAQGEILNEEIEGLRQHPSFAYLIQAVKVPSEPPYTTLR